MNVIRTFTPLLSDLGEDFYVRYARKGAGCELRKT
jgi:hypothetical protein